MFRLVCSVLLLLGNLPMAWAEPCGRVDPTGMVEWPKVELLSAGEEPRRALRVQLEPGDVQIRRFEMVVSMAQVGESGPVQAVPLPVLVFDIETRVDSVDASGLAWVDYRYLQADAHPAPEVPQEVLEATRAPIRSLTGVKGRYVLSDCLYADSISVEPPEGLDPAIQQQLQDLEATIGLFSDPLPDAAVGVGARWKVRWSRVENSLTHVGTGGVRMDQTAIYTIESMDMNQITLRSELTQSAKAQEMEPPELVNLVVKLVSMESSGKGSTVLDLNSVLPIQATTELGTEQQLTVDHGLGDELQTQQVHVRSLLHIPTP